MNDVELFFSLANIFYLIGTILLTRRVIKNRNTLKDFDPYGSSTNFIGMTINSLALAGLGMYTTIIISTPTMVFWAIVAIYSFRQLKRRKT